MTRARTPRPHEVDDARRDERLLRARRDGGRDPAWRTRGACRSVDPELFFPAPSEPADAAVELCRSCPVQGSCLAWALQVGDLYGVWGGTTARERRAMAVVWRRWQRDGPGAYPETAPLPDPGMGAEDPGSGPAGTDPDPETGRDGGGFPPSPGFPAASGPPGSEGASAPAPELLPELGVAMDRAELLRMVRAG